MPRICHKTKLLLTFSQPIITSVRRPCIFFSAIFLCRWPKRPRNMSWCFCMYYISFNGIYVQESFTPFRHGGHLFFSFFQASLMGVSGTTTTTTTIPTYEPVRRDSFRPPSLEAADNSLALTSSLSPVDEQVIIFFQSKQHYAKHIHERPKKLMQLP